MSVFVQVLGIQDVFLYSLSGVPLRFGLLGFLFGARREWKFILQRKCCFIDRNIIDGCEVEKLVVIKENGDEKENKMN